MGSYGASLASMSHPDGPAVRLLKRYGFSIEYADTLYEETVTQSTMGLPPAVQAPSADDDRRAADALHFMSPKGWFLSKDAAEAETLEAFKTFLLEAKKRGHDTYFSRALLNTRSQDDFATGQTFWRAFLRGSTWKA